MPTPEEIIMGRKSPVLAAREKQLSYNHLAASGGRPYIDARLWRAPNESDLSWNGSAAIPHDPLVPGAERAFGMVGRKDRTTYVNDAGRVASKIRQYLFKSPVQRDTPQDSPELAAIGGEGVGVDAFMQGVSDEITVGQWCWIGVSRDAAPGNLAERGAERSAAVRWTLYPARSVVDWSLDEAGRVRWLLLETESVDDADPFAERRKLVCRDLWMTGADGVTRTRYETAADGAIPRVTASETMPLPRLPFVLVGRPSPDPWWFDDVEQIQCQMLNLDSLHTENLVRTVFPQLVISETTYNSLQTRLVEQFGAQGGEVAMRVVKEIVRGADAPIVEAPEDKGVTRFICPSAADLSQLPTEIERKRKLLFDMSGLSLFNRETRQVESAESKAFDHLDTESTLRHRSRMMERAEREAVAVARLLDPAFPDYSPVWPTSFDVPDPAADMAVIQTVGNLPDTVPAMRRLVLRAALRILSEICGDDAELLETARREIDKADLSQDALAREVFGDGGGR